MVASGIPQALQMVWPLSSRRQRGVMVVPQFWHAGITLAVFWPSGGPVCEVMLSLAVEPRASPEPCGLAALCCALAWARAN